MAMKSMYPYIIFCAVLVLTGVFESGLTTSICTRYPTITGYSRPYGLSVPMYKFTWQLPDCDQPVSQYEIEVIGSCSVAQPTTLLTGRNETYTEINIQSCADEGCYARIRAKLSSGVYSPYSPCVQISNQFLQYERHSEQSHRDTCVPIQSICRSSSVPNFFINGISTSWPLYNTQYYISYNSTTRSNRFCFVNLTVNTVLTEYCRQYHSASCTICSSVTGEMYFLSHSDIFIWTRRNISEHLSPSSAMAHYDNQLTATSTSQLITLKPHSITVTLYSNFSDKDWLPDKYDSTSLLLLYAGVTAISVVCILIAMVIFIASIGSWYYRKINVKNANIYDEPITCQAFHPNIRMNINDSYIHVKLKTEST